MHHENGRKMKTGTVTDIIYINNADIEFYRTDGGLLGGKYKDYNGRVNLYRVFPLTEKTRYISVRDNDLNELGIIADMAVFGKDKQDLINEELDRRYFVPKITKIIDARQDFGTFFMNVETTSGKRLFSMRDLANNIIRTQHNSIILIDVDGSRYELENPEKNAGKAMKFLDIWL